MTADPHHPFLHLEEDLTIDELRRLQGVKPVTSLEELAHPELWDSDEDYEEFLADLYANRRGTPPT